MRKLSFYIYISTKTNRFAHSYPLLCAMAAAVRGNARDRLIPLAGSADRNRARPVKSMGIQRPVAPQSVVTKSMILDKSFYKSRLDEKQSGMLAPLGSPAAHDVQPHDIILARRIPGSYSSLGYPQEFGVACVNGIMKDEEHLWGVAGVAQTASSNENGAASDDAFTVNITGTVTTINTGNLIINPGDKVYVKMEPLVVRRADGVLVPAVDQNGVPRDKFRPQTLPWTPTAITTELAIYQRRVADMYAQWHAQYGGNPFTQEALRRLHDMVDLPSTGPGGGTVRSLPHAKLYMAATLCKRLLFLYLARMSPLPDAQGIFSYLESWWTAYGRRDGKVHDSVDDSRRASIRCREIENLPAGQQADQIQTDVVPIVMRLLQSFETETLISSDSYRAQASKMIIGTALGAAASGQPLNINLGYCA